MRGTRSSSNQSHASVLSLVAIEAERNEKDCDGRTEFNSVDQEGEGSLLLAQLGH